MRHMGVQVIDSARHGRMVLRTTGQDIHHSATAMTHVATAVAYPEPLTPSAGAPACPKINSQLHAALTTFPMTAAMMTGRTGPMACSV